MGASSIGRCFRTLEEPGGICGIMHAEQQKCSTEGDEAMHGAVEKETRQWFFWWLCGFSSWSYAAKHRHISHAASIWTIYAWIHRRCSVVNYSLYEPYATAR